MRSLLDGLSATRQARGITSVDDIRGRMSQRNVENPTAFERANYINVLQGYHVRAPAGTR
jgi:dihydroorotate dehydrogenase (fumarate)